MMDDVDCYTFDKAFSDYNTSQDFQEPTDLTNNIIVSYLQRLIVVCAVKKLANCPWSFYPRISSQRSNLKNSLANIKFILFTRLTRR